MILKNQLRDQEVKSAYKLFVQAKEKKPREFELIKKEIEELIEKSAK